MGVLLIDLGYYVMLGKHTLILVKTQHSERVAIIDLEEILMLQCYYFDMSVCIYVWGWTVGMGS